MPPLRLFPLHRLQRQPVHATGLQGIAQDGVKDSADADLDAGIAKVPEIHDCDLRPGFGPETQHESAAQ